MNSAIRSIAVLLALAFAATDAGAWGYWAHRTINRAAAGALPDAMRETIASRIDDLAAHAPGPDLWKNDPAERSRHFIDLELGDASGPPFARLPRNLRDAVRALGADSVAKMGTLPWRIDEMYQRLVQEMRRPSDSLWGVMAALGHYVADAHMPMHATINYDGQRTGNRGIHFRFEWWMLEPHRGEIVLAPYAPLWVYDPLDVAWRAIRASYGDIDTLLAAETAVRRSFRPPIDGPDGRRLRDPEFDRRLWVRLGGIAVDRMNAAALAVAGYWYAAWLEAGKPDLRLAPTPPPPPPGWDE